MPFLGANDGASGVAVLCTLASDMATLEGQWGVDFVLFDGEELVYNERRDNYFLGSTWFARQYIAEPPPYRYRWGVLLDMVGDASLQIYQERYSTRWDDTRPLVDQIWRTAQRLGVQEFIARRRHWIRDDHLPLHDIAGIPTCDIIDFDYPFPGSRESYWHTTADRPENCSPLSLAKVGWVIREWLKETAQRDEP
jgi:Zn-dependent M28 family amino/carboxypeptidase